MDITSSPPPTTTPTTPTTTTTTTTSIKSLDQDSRIQPNHHTLPKHLPPPFTNGVLKRHKPRHHHHNHHNPPPVVVAYKECLKNHAASMGGHAVDGCGEFTPSASSTPTDPTSLKCAACGCHRNFHRRAGDSTEEQFLIEYQPHHRHHPPPPPPPPQPISVAGVTPNSSSPADSPSPPPISSSYYPSAPHMLLALSSGVSVQQHPETHHGFGSNPNQNPNGKKRFRTKFSQDQKEKMHELAERVGWKMQKRDEELIKGFCNEIGVDKGVFKVWMHNNKMTFGVKNNNSNNKDSGGGIDFLTDRNNHHHELQHHHHHHQQEQEQEQEQQGHNDSVSSGGGNVIGTNGSSSSS